jgi:hypothetical protein
VADPESGSLKPEFEEEWESQVGPLEPESLVPAWWPERPEEDPVPWTPRERARAFEADLLAYLTVPTSRASGSASPTRQNWTPQEILQSLRRLRSAVAPEPILTRD